MDLTVHQQVLGAAFLVALAVGAVANKTSFCTMGAVSDWINIGDTGRMRAWLLAMSVAIAGVLLLQSAGKASIPIDTFPPYRTPNFAWLRYLIGGFAFGVGMTLGSGCGSKTLIRVGSGNLKSVVVLIAAAVFAYLMVWTDFYTVAFNSWLAPTTLNLTLHGIRTQALGDVLARLAGSGDGAQWNVWLGWALAAGIAAFVFASREFRASFDNILGGIVVGLAVVAGWYITAGALGQEWKEFTEMSAAPPSRVAVQSFTFISPMADSLHYLGSPTNLGLINFGIMAFVGVIAGSALYAALSRTFRLEWFANRGDFFNHVAGGALMGIGGVLAMGCTVGQAITGVSTLALGSIMTFGAIVAGSAATMKFQYWRMMRED
ncbi:MAG: YeeE/YedE family protein [Burkholderiales bacterium]|nr:YeeE/YedE family protein [Burkholderiales bacterium]